MLALSPVDAARLLGPLLEHGDHGADAALREVLDLLSGSQPGAAYVLDWLRKVHGFETAGYCYQGVEELPRDWREFLEELRDLPQPPSPVERVRQGARLDRLRAEFQRLYTHNDHSYVVAGERASWQVIVDAYAPYREALERGRPIPPPELSEDEIDRAEAKGELIPGSKLARHFRRLVEDLYRKACELQGAVACAHPVAHRPAGGTAGPLGDLLRAAREVALGERTAHDALVDLGRRVEGLGDKERTLVARITEPWHDSGEWDHPLLRPLWTRRRRVREQVEDLLRQGVGREALELVELFLADDDLDQAEAMLAEETERHRQSARQRQVRDRLERAGKLIERLREPGGLSTKHADLRQREAELSVEDARQIEREATARLRDEQVADARAQLDRLEELGARQALELAQGELEAWSRRTALVSDDELAALHSLVSEATTTEREALRKRLDAVRQSLQDLIDRMPEDARRDLVERVTTIEVEIAEDDLPHARVLLTELEADLQRQLAIRWNPADGEEVLVRHVIEFVTHRAAFDPYDVRRLHVALKAKRFVVLAGLTGTGKSTLAREYAAALGATKASGRFRRVAVRPNWVDGSEVLGYVHPITQRFEPGWLASVVRDCLRAPDLPLFVVLDEMNLAPVEHYLSDVLSAMEEGAEDGDRPTLQLYNPGAHVENEKDWPAELPFPRNLYLVGTVNVDESTRPLTDRVLDRASLIQLRASLDDRHHEARERERSRPPLELRMADLARIRTDRPEDRIHRDLVALGDTLGLMGIGLGARNHIEIERLLANAAGVLEPEDAVDAAFLQRVLPRVRGYKRDLAPHLGELLEHADRLGARRSARVLRHWIEDLSEHGYVDGTSARVGIVAHR